MHKWLVVLVAIASLALAVPAMADDTGNSCPPGYSQYRGNCLPDNSEGGVGSVVNNTNQQGQIQGQMQGQLQLQGQLQGQAIVDSGNATIEEGAVDVDNTDVNVNNNTDINVNKQANKQETNIKFEDKRDLLGLGDQPTADAKLHDTRASEVRARGSLLDRVQFLTMSMAKRASKNASDMQVEPALLFENDFELDKIKVGQGPQFGGYIYVFADGSDCYLAAMDAEASEVAMKAGMTHIVRLGEVEVSKVLSGSAWNIGFGGGASIMTSGEDMGIAPNGGFGYGKAKSSSQFRPDAVYEVSYDASLIREK